MSATERTAHGHEPDAKIEPEVELAQVVRDLSDLRLDLRVRLVAVCCPLRRAHATEPSSSMASIASRAFA